MSWLVLSLICAASLAGADAATKRLLPDYSAARLTLVRFGTTAILLLPWLWLHPPPPVPAAFWGWVGAALPLEILAMALYVLAIRDSPLALTLPMLAFTPVFTAFAGWGLLGENVSLQGAGGILLVVMGAWALNFHDAERHPRTWAKPLFALVRERCAQRMLVVAAIYGVTSVLGKGALQYMPAISFGPFYFVLLGLLSVAVFCVREPSSLHVMVDFSRRHLLVAGLMAVMVVTHFLALSMVETAYMISVKRTSVLFGIVLGAWLFREERLRQHLVGGSLMVGGVAVIALA